MKTLGVRSKAEGSQLQLDDLRVPASQIFSCMTRHAVDLARRVHGVTKDGHPDKDASMRALKAAYGSYRLAKWKGFLDSQSVEVLRARTADNLDERGAAFLAGLYRNSCPLSQEVFSGILRLCAQEGRRSSDSAGK